MSETIETFNPAHLNRSDTLSSIVTVGKPGLAGGKTTKLASSAQRLDFEPLYTDLKALIGHNWGVYHDALTRFIQGKTEFPTPAFIVIRSSFDSNTAPITGELSALEFGDLTDNFLLATPVVEHAHNSLICAIFLNTTREVPDQGPAAWVSAATDKVPNALASKPGVASDAAEQRLKLEVMSLMPRDRRRIKAIAADKAEDEAAARRNIYEEYYRASKIRVPDSVPASAGGLNKTNWDLEIRKRYTQPLFSETLEFPDAATIFARMVPICYEESVAAGSNQTCAELVAIAAESYVKDFLAQTFDRTRANGPKYDTGAGGGVFTGAYKRQLEREEEDFKNGKVQKGRENGLLPVEAREATTRRPIGMADMKVAANMGRGLWNGMPLIGTRIVEAALEDELEEWKRDREAEQDWYTHAKLYAAANGTDDTADEPMDMDDDEYGWEGVGGADREALGSLLENCLAVRA